MSADILTLRQGVFERDDELAAAGHEQIVFCRDDASALKAIISIHDTTLGPALGGTRFYPYATESEALRDGLRLSQGMTFKNAAANLPLGGGKAVIIGDPTTAKTPELLRAYGRFVERLNGLYVTAADVGTDSDDLDVIGRATSHVVGRNAAAGGSGDSGGSTALGVFHAMRAAAEFTWGSDGLNGRTVGVEGLGKVGRVLVDLLRQEGVTLVVTDPSDEAVRRVAEHGDAVRVVGSLAGVAMDVYAPCALGATLTAESVGALQASLVCGAANNQLATGDIGALLFQRGITWVPDYVANAGGVIQVGGELLGHTPEQVLHDICRVGDTTREILTRSAEAGIPAGMAAADIVNARLQAARDRS
ncbi:Glu/Leu/Phe/Val family dehydrogenase [Actinacidiphila sp. bgisy144]|uniref:Glu/Leu/Phe/Val family dehydrogenase n=1 Tax=Actinacidiphila sp. bgisy144 TaxID=3413791 RepID=UPI003EBC4DF5